MVVVSEARVETQDTLRVLAEQTGGTRRREPQRFRQGSRSDRRRLERLLHGRLLLQQRRPVQTPAEDRDQGRRGPESWSASDRVLAEAAAAIVCRGATPRDAIELRRRSTNACPIAFAVGDPGSGPTYNSAAGRGSIEGRFGRDLRTYYGAGVQSSPSPCDCHARLVRRRPTGRNSHRRRRSLRVRRSRARSIRGPGRPGGAPRHPSAPGVWSSRNLSVTINSPPRSGVALTTGERRTDVNIALKRALAIEGRVLDPWGSPMSDVRVMPMRADGTPYPSYGRQFR